MTRALKKDRRAQRSRSQINQGQIRPRLSVFRSNKYIYAQIIDDKAGKTLVAVSIKELKDKVKDKQQQARELGKVMAAKANKGKIKKVVFDKGPYKYHGRVKALAEGAREGGLDF